MNRMINEKVAVSVTRETGFAALNRFGAVLVNSVRRHFKRAAIERELSRLDNRMLGDLGLNRSEIGFVAQQAVAVPGEGTLFQEFSRLVFNVVVRPVVEWNRRREIYDQLMSMDDRMLADIGMTRYDAAEYVRRLGREVQEPLPEALAAMEQDLTAPIRMWNRARLTARQLDELTDRQLVDIGVVRGDIDELAHEVARKAVANFNFRPETPKAA
ncbi:DUF1127 domain-containing protein [Dongia sedimenti]|uniref:DUF1127 domain-containing protein n=1 Tax=Dongia sedimenti TaxID=3064282 RepID=A0ABU0YHC4_9PROT|nr:DUF1127 domain-containing protein [Rhodospirillaceae bacterium R-7]